jgi:hypothetical protein
VGGTPAIEGQRRAVVAQKPGIQGLERASASRRVVKLSCQGGAPLPSAPALRARSMRANGANLLRMPKFIFCVFRLVNTGRLPIIYARSAGI